ncbi:rhodanese-like domain-containing protein [Uliginosibacterium aquaticum]|uniref:Rhodanese-like domain-containing protein n=1 Tax=Uliginosibacterium aquaticum TaxID=2731212 RepID=A0ABX2IH09_9RHOO|nr:rhodanese-like domain-containing protein [Uliginosibacterium aquaticum]NSL56030.1 rhodanese-like domain-containing protein [Uliginosibacterium aquaticum]
MLKKLCLVALLALTGGLVSAKTVLIDVRTPEEYAAGHLEGALNIDHQLIGQRIGMAGVSKDDEVQLYCRSGRRSALAVQTLGSLGYRKLIDLGSMETARAKLCAAKGNKAC